MPIGTNNLNGHHKVSAQARQIVAIGMFDPGPIGTGSNYTSKHRMRIHKVLIQGILTPNHRMRINKVFIMNINSSAPHENHIIRYLCNLGHSQDTLIIMIAPRFYQVQS